jgi:hypothetical protein
LQYPSEFVFNDLSGAQMCTVVDNEYFFLGERWRHTGRRKLNAPSMPHAAASARPLCRVTIHHKCSHNLVGHHWALLPWSQIAYPLNAYLVRAINVPSQCNNY